MPIRSALSLSTRELKELAISAIALSFAFAYDGIFAISELPYKFPLAFLAVSTGFVFHELAHRFVANLHGCRAEYRMWRHGVLLAVLLAIVSNGSFSFAAPGAVVIYPRIDLWGRVKSLSKRDEAKIALAGPVANLVIAFSLLTLAHLLNNFVLFYIASVNAWLALFNLLPIFPLDGMKVFAVSRKMWAASIALALVAFLLTV